MVRIMLVTKELVEDLGKGREWQKMGWSVDRGRSRQRWLSRRFRDKNTKQRCKWQEGDVGGRGNKERKRGEGGRGIRTKYGR